jgi:phosphoenolpyruvate-protein phosphotransferase (PTS system enzyme I)
MDREFILKGAPISDGVAMGIPYFLPPAEDREVPEFPINQGEIEGEIIRYRKAVFSSREDLRRLQEDLSSEGSREIASIIAAHIQMLDDPLMTTTVESKIKEMLKNTESVFHSVVHDYEKRFSETNDAFFNERLSDFKDLSQRVLKNLNEVHHVQIPPQSILFAEELVPSDIAILQRSQVWALVTESGGGTSHAALIARAKGIPYVAGIDMTIFFTMQADFAIVDGLKGEVIINPSKKTVAKYRALQKEHVEVQAKLEMDKNLSSETIDGYPISLYANVSTMSEIDLAFHNSAEGIGLFRSEFLFLHDPSLFFDEERQYFIYQQMLRRHKKGPFTFRVMDLGGDKYSEVFDEMKEEPNPVLGCRGIRFLLKRQDIFRRQLRAVLRAGIHSNLQILFPLVTDIAEFREVKKIVEEVKADLTDEGLSHLLDPKVGCMLEVPSAVLICDTLAQESDFLALGTNDLIQYTLGVDRSNLSMSDFYYPTHPGVIRMIKMTILQAKRFDKPVTVCGEIASNPLFTGLLIGLGVERFSCAPRFIPLINQTVRRLFLLECYDMAEHILTLRTSAEIFAFLSDKLQKSEKAAELKI